MADIDQQPSRDLAGTDALDKIRSLADGVRTCFFTSNPGGFPASSTPMSVQDVEDDGTIWFISSTQSDRNRHIASDPRVSLSFQNEGKYEYLVLQGEATIHTDRATVEAHWTSLANAWFEDGIDDPRVSVIAFRPREGHYWETKAGKLVAFAKMSFAALTGSRVDDGGVEGSLKV
jgi:general stress protein 26